MRSDFYGLPYAARQAIRKGEQACSRGRRLAIAAASEKSASAELVEALESTRAALRILQPALNVMARECLDDIIAREIDAALVKHRGER